MMKATKFLNILIDKSIPQDDYALFIFDKKQKEKIIKNIHNFNDLNKEIRWGNGSYNVPAWFFLLRDPDIFDAFQTRCDIDTFYKSSQNNRNDYSNIYNPISFPYFYNFNVKTFNQLFKSIEISNDLFYNLVEYPLFGLDVFKSNIIDFDESLLIGQRINYSQNISSLLYWIIEKADYKYQIAYNEKNIDEMQKVALETFYVCNEFVKLGAKDRIESKIIKSDGMYIASVDWQTHIKEINSDMFQIINIHQNYQHISNTINSHCASKNEKPVKVKL